MGSNSYVISILSLCSYKQFLLIGYPGCFCACLEFVYVVVELRAD